MTKIYACLTGNWTLLNEDPNCTIGEQGLSPEVWWENGAELWSPTTKSKQYEHSFYGLDYVNIYYDKQHYRINPCFIQVIE